MIMRFQMSYCTRVDNDNTRDNHVCTSCFDITPGDRVWEYSVSRQGT